MSKLLSQGGFGCVFYPKIKCNGKSSTNKRYVTKIQKFNFNSKNETLVGSLIKKIPKYKNFFLPVVKQCNININNITDTDIHKCKVIKTSVPKYIAMDIPYMRNKKFVDILENLDKKHMIVTVLDSYKALLNSLHMLNSHNIIHFDLKLDNIIFEKDTNMPHIIDFGISIPVDHLHNDNFNKYFYIFAPHYIVWCADIHVIGFLLYKTKKPLTNDDAEYITNKYMDSKLFNYFDSGEKTGFKEKCLKQLKTYVDIPRKNLIFKLLNYRRTWDNYSLSVIYLRILKTVFEEEKNNELIKEFIELLHKNLSPDPDERFSLQDTLTKYEAIFYK